MFSFSTTAGASQSTSKPRLAGNSIHTVKLDGCEIQDIAGVKDITQVYKVLKLKFSNEDGYFEHTVFEPKPQDMTRTESEFTKEGKVNKIPQPSNVESMMLLFKHVIDAFVPEIAGKIDRNEQQLVAKNWEELRKLVKAILDKGIGNTSNIKLITDNKGEAKFPGFFAAVNKEGKAYVRNNFCGAKVAFTSYESEKINKTATAKPTPMSKTEEFNLDTDTSLNLDFDLSGL